MQPIAKVLVAAQITSQGVASKTVRINDSNHIPGGPKTIKYIAFWKKNIILVGIFKINNSRGTISLMVFDFQGYVLVWYSYCFPHPPEKIKRVHLYIYFIPYTLKMYIQNDGFVKGVFFQTSLF